MMAKRSFARTLHLILGLGAGILLALTGITGGLLAFGAEIDRGLNSSLWRCESIAARAGLEQVRRAAEATGGPPARMLLMPGREDRSILVLLAGRDPADRWEVFIDPHTAKVLGRRRYGSAWVEKVKALHAELFAGRAGRLVVGAGGLISLAMGATGAILGWRTRPAGRSRGGASSAFSLHRRVGLLGLIPSSILATTGALLVFRPYLAPALNLLTGPMPLDATVASRGDRGEGPPTLDQIRDRASRLHPDGQITRLYLPERPEGTFAVRMWLPADQNPHGNTAMRFDRFDGRLLQHHSSRDATFTQRVVWFAAYPWHTGDALGLAGRALVAACGILPALLMSTGIMLWVCRLQGSIPGKSEGADPAADDRPTH